MQKVSVGALGGASHSTLELVQLGQSEAVRPVDDQRIGIRNVQAAFDDAGTHQHIDVARRELEHRLLQFPFGHLPVGDRDPRLGHQFSQPLCHLVDTHHPVVDEIHLPAPVDLS